MPDTAPQPLAPFHSALLSLVRRTPLKRGAARAWFIRYFRKHIAHPVMTDFRGVPIILNLDNNTEQKALFGHYDLEELAFLKESFRNSADPVFVDIGANAGFYTQNFLALGKGRILAIEPNPDMAARIRENHAFLQTRQANIGTLLLEECGIGAEEATCHLDLSNGVGGAHVVAQANPDTIAIRITPLIALLEKHNIRHIDAMKIDVEGYEDRALIPFLQHAPDSCLPHCLVMEYTSNKRWEGDVLTCLREKGYRLIHKTRGNFLLQRDHAG